MCGDFSANDYAKNCLKPERVPVDLDWFEQAFTRLRV